MIAIIKYNAGNIKSVENAVTRLGYNCVVTDNIDEIKKSEKVIFPGVGEAGSAMKYLREKKLDVLIKTLQQPVLGICLGQQLMCNFSEEGNTECLGIFDTSVKLFPSKEIVPHMGWNDLKNMRGDLFKGIQEKENVYFIHSFYSEICDKTVAICDYILPFSAALEKNNFYSTQFHPEKSAMVGEKILFNFLLLNSGTQLENSNYINR